MTIHRTPYIDLYDRQLNFITQREFDIKQSSAKLLVTWMGAYNSPAVFTITSYCLQIKKDETQMIYIGIKH